MSPEDFDAFEDGPTTEDLAAEVESLRQELSDLRQVSELRQSRLEHADRQAELAFLAAVQPQAANYQGPDLVAATPPPQRPSLTPEQTAALTKQAISVVASTNEGWHEVSEKVVERVRQNPSRLGELAQSGPMALAGYLSSIAQSERASADTRAMKMAAQSMQGSSGRTPAPDDFQQRWQEIMNAPSDKLGL